MLKVQYNSQILVNDGCCNFPFTYLGVTYKECTTVAHHKLWCATQVDADGNYNGNWKNCDKDCNKGGKH